MLWLWQFLIKVGISTNHSTTVVHEDNQGCIAIANLKANTNSKHMKHVEIQLHFIREVIKNSKIVLFYMATTNMLADFLTKSIPRPALLRLLAEVGLLRLEERGVLKSKPLFLHTHLSTPTIFLKPLLTCLR